MSKEAQKQMLEGSDMSVKSGFCVTWLRHQTSYQEVACLNLGQTLLLGQVVHIPLPRAPLKLRPSAAKNLIHYSTFCFHNMCSSCATDCQKLKLMGK